MIFVFLFQFIRILTANSLTTPSPYHCPDGFTVLNTNTCVKLSDKPLLYQDAVNYCKNISGGTLVSIKNAIDNRALVNIATSKNLVHPVWIGLYCSSSSSSACSWVDGSGQTNSYNNFASGNPFIDVGSNVYMLPTGNSAGKWVSADGTVSLLNYFCEAATDMEPEFCHNEFNNHCYTLNINNLNYEDSRKFCRNDCGDLVSILSQEENNHVYGLLPDYLTFVQMRIGARTDGIGKYWVDGSPFNYSNFAFFNPEVGKCSVMETLHDIVGPSQWISNNCNETIPFVCKRAKNVTSCEPTPSPTVNPTDVYQCLKTQFFSGNGKIYSPFYPNPFSPVFGQCTYVITVPSGSNAQVIFSSQTYISKSRMYFFSQLEDTSPFTNFTGYAPKVAIISTTNVMKMLFIPVSVNYDVGEQWVAHYGNNYKLPQP